MHKLYTMHATICYLYYTHYKSQQFIIRHRGGSFIHSFIRTMDSGSFMRALCAVSKGSGVKRERATKTPLFATVYRTLRVVRGEDSSAPERVLKRAEIFEFRGLQSLFVHLRYINKNICTIGPTIKPYACTRAHADE